MILKLPSMTLCTNDGRLIERLHCPLNMDWEQLQENKQERGRDCGPCGRTVLDTGLFTEEELLQRLQAEPHTCLMIDLQHANITLRYERHYDPGRMVHHSEHRQ